VSVLGRDMLGDPWRNGDRYGLPLLFGVPKGAGDIGVPKGASLPLTVLGGILCRRQINAEQHCARVYSEDFKVSDENS